MSPQIGAADCSSATGTARATTQGTSCSRWKAIWPSRPSIIGPVAIPLSAARVAAANHSTTGFPTRASARTDRATTRRVRSLMAATQEPGSCWRRSSRVRRSGEKFKVRQLTTFPARTTGTATATRYRWAFWPQIKSLTIGFPSRKMASIVSGELVFCSGAPYGRSVLKSCSPEATVSTTHPSCCAPTFRASS